MEATGIHIGNRVTMNDDLRIFIGIGFEQHWIHVGMWRQTRCSCLHGLCAANLSAIGSDDAVERHILRLEGRHSNALACQPTAECRHQHAFACIRCGALNHQGLSSHGAGSAKG